MMSESVTVTVQNGAEPNRGTAGQPPIFSLNVDYFRSIPGLIKIAQIILGIICIALGSPGYSAGNWFIFVAVTTFVLSVIWSMIYLFSVRESVKLNINWLLTELCNTGIYTVFYLTAFIIELCFAAMASYVAAGIFGLFNTLAYALGTYYLYLEYVGSQR